ncbi:MAG: 23S rRNA (guanosine(2251)-2'-O)-methyltransferase RlmB [Actinomycetota bacterium]|nr:23S rRNA (guanosine(2251)-2'-O)-methyltransferase RlmB [Actinomycetota bacterium]
MRLKKTGKRAPDNKKDLVYGFNPVLEAVRSGRALKVLVSTARREGLETLVAEASSRGIPVEKTAPAFFEPLAKGHQSVAAITGALKEATLEDMLQAAQNRGEPPLVLALDGVEDPRNLGGIMRSALAAGAHGLIMEKHRSPGLIPEVFKSSAGAAEYLPISVQPNIKYSIDELRDQGILVVGAEAGDHPAPWQAGLSGPLALVLGGEASGIRRIVAARCDLMVSIPLSGPVSSLNVSVAAGVILFEIKRQRSSKMKI